MLHVDADELYDLSEAGRMLLADPVRIRRLARRRRAPLVPRPEGAALPRAWVDAASGKSPSDPEALLGYWLERLAPPSPEARRAVRDRGTLEAPELLSPAEVAARLYADAARVLRLTADGILPALRVDGETRYDARLVEHVADGDADGAAARRAEVEAWARLEYVSGLDEGAKPPPTEAKPAPAKTVAAAPRAWHLPDDIAEIEPLPADAPAPAPEGGEEAPPAPDGSRLIRTEGFETEDED